MKCLLPNTVKVGFTRGIPIFRIFDPLAKHTLWVLIRTASARRSYRVPTINALSKNIEIIELFPMKFSIFKAEKKPLYIAWVSLRNEFSFELQKTLLACHF